MAFNFNIRQLIQNRIPLAGTLRTNAPATSNTVSTSRSVNTQSNYSTGTSSSTHQSTSTQSSSPSSSSGKVGDSLNNPYILTDDYVDFTADDPPKYLKKGNDLYIFHETEDDGALMYKPIDLRGNEIEGKDHLQISFTGQTKQVQVGTVDKQVVGDPPTIKVKVGTKTVTETVNFGIEVDGNNAAGPLGELIDKDVVRTDDVNKLFNGNNLSKFAVKSLSDDSLNLNQTNANATDGRKTGTFELLAGDPKYRKENGPEENVDPKLGFFQLYEDGTENAQDKNVGRSIKLLTHAEEINDKHSKAFTEYSAFFTTDNGQKVSVKVSGGVVQVTDPLGKVIRLNPPDGRYVVGDPNNPTAVLSFKNLPGGENGTNEKRFTIDYFEPLGPKAIADLVSKGVSPADASKIHGTTEITLGFRTPGDPNGTYAHPGGVAPNQPPLTGANGVKYYYDLNLEKRPPDPLTLTRTEDIFKEVPNVKTVKEPIYKTLNEIEETLVSEDDCTCEDDHYTPPPPPYCPPTHTPAPSFPPFVDEPPPPRFDPSIFEDRMQTIQEMMEAREHLPPPPPRPPGIDPLYLDLSGDGKIASKGDVTIKADFDGDGDKDSTHRVEGLLFLDKNRDGSVQTGETFGNFTDGQYYNDGLEALNGVAKNILGDAAYSVALSRGYLNEADIAKMTDGGLRILGSDGKPTTLTQLNITKLGLVSTDKRVTNDEVDAFSTNVTNFEMNGKTHTAYDLDIKDESHKKTKKKPSKEHEIWNRSYQSQHGVHDAGNHQDKGEHKRRHKKH